jgi:hypothetical protein
MRGEQASHRYFVAQQVLFTRARGSISLGRICGGALLPPIRLCILQVALRRALCLLALLFIGRCCRLRFVLSALNLRGLFHHLVALRIEHPADEAARQCANSLRKATRLARRLPGRRPDVKPRTYPAVVIFDRR